MMNKITDKIINIPKKVTDHLIGEDHTPTHRKFVGIVIMAVGVVIAKSGNLFTIHIVHYICDGIGYLIHGIGALPIVEQILKNNKTHG